MTEVEQIIKNDIAQAKAEDILSRARDEWEWTVIKENGIVVRRGYKCPNCGCICMEMDCSCITYGNP